MVDSTGELRNVSGTATYGYRRHHVDQRTERELLNLLHASRYDGSMNAHECWSACGSPSMRRFGILLVLALLFSGDIVRIHGHAGDAPASPDCVACSASLAAAVEADPPPALDPPAPSDEDGCRAAAAATPSLVFVRQGGLRDPPTRLA
jgi:hypothetical protein